jgi:hypothetical protein
MHTNSLAWYEHFCLLFGTHFPSSPIWTRVFRPPHISISPHVYLACRVKWTMHWQPLVVKSLGTPPSCPSLWSSPSSSMWQPWFLPSSRMQTRCARDEWWPSPVPLLNLSGHCNFFGAIKLTLDPLDANTHKATRTYSPHIHPHTLMLPHPLALQAVLMPGMHPGRCLPLKGSVGWVDIRLSRPIHLTALTYEHVPRSIALDISAAPRMMAVMGYSGREPGQQPVMGGGAAGGKSGFGVSSAPPCASGGTRIGQFEYDPLRGPALQTFVMRGEGDAQVQVDHLRVHVLTNHGNPNYTCVYRIRVHGNPIEPQPLK